MTRCVAFWLAARACHRYAFQAFHARAGKWKVETEMPETSQTFASIAPSYDLTTEALMALKRPAGPWPDDIDPTSDSETWAVLLAAGSEAEQLLGVLVCRVAANTGDGELAVASFPLACGNLIVVQPRRVEQPTVHRLLARHVETAIRKNDPDSADRWLAIGARLYDVDPSDRTALADILRL